MEKAGDQLAGSGEETLFLVWHDARDREIAGEGPDIFCLAENLYLVRSAETLSSLYHAVKRRTQPGKLLVARLAGPPKFKGMAEGALKWVRAV
ncbi:hypothetical protein [Oricola cellulosilytica]|uniref:Uncharacterized protein n=1 Tax=Oricola cellulosilytica TaxID=1429082 RepID=A0A4R0PF77_9HYPH|nr:hypothetical protein [Oricola cellulosilytica]TCD15308.1 hypothetical protein E0D97_07165 [Oricola cellulosilytica]